MIVKKKVDFDYEASKVWELLTNPKLTKRYMFGCEVLSNWEVGDSIIWKGPDKDGKEIVYVKGEIIEIEAGKMVRFNMFDPNMGIEDIPENYVNLTYKLKQVEGGTQLTLEQGDFSNVAQGQSRYDDTVKGWDMVLLLMKEVISEI